MLMAMRSGAEAMRGLAYVVAATLDRANRHKRKREREKALALAELLIPVVKGWFTETSIEIASLGVQVHGGMGYIEETGAAQYLRDARITTIYEGTTSIQANDLVGRKLARDSGLAAKLLVKEMKAVARDLHKVADPDVAAIARRFAGGVKALEQCVSWMVGNFGTDIRAVFAGAVPFLKLMGIVAGGWQLSRATLIAHAQLAKGEGDAKFLKAKIVTARFYADHYLAQAPGLRDTVIGGAPGVLALAAEQF
jgi:acyl-CoA dehydrogenase